MRRKRRVAGLGPFVLGLTLALSGVWASAASAQESWDAVYLSGAKIGYIHTFIEPLKDRGRDLLRVRVDTALTFKRLNDSITMELRYGTIETPQGEVLRIDTRTLASDKEQRVYGDAHDDKITLTLEGGGQAQQVTIPWSSEVRGPYAVEQSLSREPMKVGQTRKLKMYIPDLNKVCDITIAAKGMEDVQLGGEATKRSLMRVEQKTSLEGKPRPEFDLVFWVDPGGQVLKSVSEAMGGMVTYRTTKEAATSKEGAGKLDLITTSIIKVTHKIPSAETRRNISYRVRVKDDDLTSLIPNDRRQTLRPGGDRASGTLVVKTAGPDDGPVGPEQVDSEFLRPNALVTSEDPKVVELAYRAVGVGTNDPWQKVVKIEQWVAKNVTEKNFKTAFAPASEVARNLSGDCTEHGVLTAAMCRAVGVPARVAIGLVYADNLGGFGYHLWNEVYVNRRWVAVDSTFDETSVDAVHIKLAETSLVGVSPYEAFLPVARVLGKMTLEPVEIK